MQEEIKIELKIDKLERLQHYAKLLDKDINTLLDEALSQYFIVTEEELIAKSNATNLTYDEFWDGVDL